MRTRRSLFTTSLIVGLSVAVLGGWLLSGSSDDDYILESTMGSIALNKVSEGQMLATVDVQDVEENTVSTATWLGERLVVNFWFSTCEPCRREFPVLVNADARTNTVRFIGVNLNDSADVARTFMQTYGANFDTFLDDNGNLTSAMGIATAPVTLLIDEGGVVRRQLTGEITAEMLNAAIAEVFPGS